MAASLRQLALASRPRPALVDLHLLGFEDELQWRRVEPGTQEHSDIMSLGDQIRAAHLNGLRPARRWIPGDIDMEAVMVMMAIRASLDEVDPMQRLVDDLYDQTFVPNPAAATDVASLATSVVSTPGSTCSICLDDMACGDAHHVFACGHIMHLACSTEWFKYGTRCPACNACPFGLKGARSDGSS